MPARSRDRPPGPRRTGDACASGPAIGLVWSMNCDSWLVPKNSFSAATTGRMLISDCGVIASTSWVVIRSRTTRSMQARPVRSWFWISSPTCASGGCRSGRCRRPTISGVPWRTPGEVGRPSCSATMYRIVATMSSMVSVCWSNASTRPELLVDLGDRPSPGRSASGVEVVVVQQRLRGLARRRLARAQLAVDVEQRLVPVLACGPSPG